MEMLERLVVAMEKIANNLESINQVEKEEEKTYTVRKAAEKLGLSYHTVRKRIDEGELKASNVGTKDNHQFRIKESDIQEFLEKREVKNTVVGLAI